MVSMRASTCNWPLAHCGEGGPSDDPQCSALAALQPEMRELVQQMAVDYLWNWTRRQFGTCPVTVRPCRDNCGDRNTTTYRGYGRVTTNLPWYEGFPGPLNPALIGGQWWNLPCGGGCPQDQCSCTYVPTVELAGPVASIDSVIVNGITLDPSQYRVDNFRWLVRTDGEDWPVCQDMTKNSLFEDDTFQVTYQIGVAVPAGGQVAAGKLACEFAKAACGNGKCELPQRLQQITRQQVTTMVLDNYSTMYQFGTTGIFIVDSWVASIMASNRQTGARIASPDVRSPRRTTTF